MRSGDGAFGMPEHRGSSGGRRGGSGAGPHYWESTTRRSSESWVCRRRKGIERTAHQLIHRERSFAQKQGRLQPGGSDHHTSAGQYYQY